MFKRVNKFRKSIKSNTNEMNKTVNNYNIEINTIENNFELNFDNIEINTEIEKYKKRFGNLSKKYLPNKNLYKETDFKSNEINNHNQQNQFTVKEILNILQNDNQIENDHISVKKTIKSSNHKIQYDACTEQYTIGQ